VFDTNVIESHYLAPLLRGEQCRDFALLRQHVPSYKPGLYVKSYYEICQHAKLGTKRFPWLSDEFSYPGGVEKGRQILAQLPDCDPETNLYWWFCMAEEWTACDWSEEENRVRSFVRRSDVEAELLHLKVRREFTEWKLALSGFCYRIGRVLEGHMTVLTPSDVYGRSGEYHDEVSSLEQDLATRRLVPNEDLEIISAALACHACAFVTAEKALLTSTALSIDLNWKTAFVHVDQLPTALAEDFAFRWSRQQASPRPV
jgi:hypothetical protein